MYKISYICKLPQEENLQTIHITHAYNENEKKFGNLLILVLPTSPCVMSFDREFPTKGNWFKIKEYIVGYVCWNVGTCYDF